ncbi:DUF6580 family putative transport protein [Thalassomonas sp. M1454]|uniref:DUF6580 family putative transport protein n=1 Tax=Thalassomonas sp. M1454 TaxID=2594477 RepID=UPI00117FE915|nr:DUF6580 family putative transport protein [Thalassomonas sp. M1454]TRX56320.1 hypothetical protein FNN08_01960 [Thalassomonas sp. M1454]
MTLKNLREEHLIFAFIIVIACLRMIPHPWNFTPIGALALFSGAYLSKKGYFIIPLAALLIGDAWYGFYNGIVFTAVYLGFIASTLVGHKLLADKYSHTRLGSSIGLGALSFWLISNAGSWLAFYPLTFNGLIQCYVNGIPYLGRSLIADGLYAILIFSVFHAIKNKIFNIKLNNLNSNIA